MGSYWRLAAELVMDEFFGFVHQIRDHLLLLTCFQGTTALFKTSKSRRVLP